MARAACPGATVTTTAFAAIFDRTAGLLAICEDLPEAHNRVTLDPELVDGNGIPAPRIEYRALARTRRACSRTASRARRRCSRPPARSRPAREAPLRVAGWHLMGTARMGRDPARSVVNEWGRSHDVRNLFVIDGSIFVTAGAVNPTYTIQALALHIADSIKKNLGNLFD